MKKLVKIIGVLALLFSIVASLGSSMIESAEADVPENVSVTLHKKKMTQLPDEEIQNTGVEIGYFNQYDDMPNVTFEVRDVSYQFNLLRIEGMSVDDAMEAVANNPGETVVTSGTTGANGQVTFSLPSRSSGRDAVYVFIETNAPPGTTRADNMALVLPMFDADDNAMENILLYPKNVVAADGKVIVTKKGTANNELLENAEFIVSRELTAENIEYLEEFNTSLGLNRWVSDRADARVFTTDSSGQIVINNLEHGDYQLIEITSPDNASIIDEGIRPFTIGDGGPTFLSFKVYNDTIDVEKERAEKDDYTIGDLIPYSITVNIPEGMGYQFPNGEYRHPYMRITDVPETGLQFNNDLVLTADTTAIQVDPLWMDTSGNGFSLTIPAAALADFEGEDLTLTYNMYLDENAVPDVGYNNLATVVTDELSDNDYTPDVFTGGFRFIKIDANVDENNELEGAVFVVGRGAGADIEYLVTGANHAVSWTANIDDATDFESDADGIVEVAGLEYGNYWLQETEAPEGYVLPDGLVNFTITEGTFTQIDLLEITNVHRGRLPSTGGSGIVGIVALGAALVATTGGYYIKRKREE